MNIPCWAPSRTRAWVDGVWLDLVVGEEIYEGLGPEGGRGHDDDEGEEKQAEEVPSGRGVLLRHEVLPVATDGDDDPGEKSDDEIPCEGFEERLIHRRLDLKSLVPLPGLEPGMRD